MPTAADGRTPETDQALMGRVVEGDEDALAALYDRHAGLVFSLCRAILGTEADAEEVTEDVFVFLWTAPDRFDPDRGSLRAWLAVTARSRALDRVRSGRRRRDAHQRAASTSHDGTVVELAGQTPPDDRVHASEIREALDHALSALSEDQRRAIELAYFGGLSQSEIARRLDEPLGTVKTRIRDGLAKLRAALAGAKGSLT